MPFNNDMEVRCGPLLRYTYTERGANVWHGSVLLVVANSRDRPPTLYLKPEHFPDHAKRVTGIAIHLDDNSSGPKTFWRFSLDIPLSNSDQRVDYQIKLFEQESRCCNASFYVPGKDESMRILFHSCNGFSLAVKQEDYAGSLWKDVLRTHSEKPFHVMIGGGDQVYSDAVRVTGPLKKWADRMSPRQRSKTQLTDQLSKDMDDWYFENYREWYTEKPFKDAAASIPAVQIFDDHDIIDGYGSYPDRFMRAPIFLEIGKVAWRYYMLFQQHTPPEGEVQEDPSWVIGTQQGQYIKQRSRSICTTFGKRVLFYGLDCRVDRTIDRVCHDSTYDLMFDRLEKEVSEDTKHIILLLGVPIAYPRLVWLENFLSTYTIAPLRWLNKLFGIAGGMFNKFDGSAELLDDLTDHWCAGTHKLERNKLVTRLQGFAAKKRVRITILSGDVHLACIGRFFSKKSLQIAQNVDHRYMVNVVSSAITNAPPPAAVANLMNRRNKLHHFDENTDENLMDIFHENPDGKVNMMNHTTMPARNFCIITEHAGLAADKSSGKMPSSSSAEHLPLPEHECRGESSDSNAESLVHSDAAAAVKASKVNAKAEENGSTNGKGGTEALKPACAQKGSVDDPSAQAPHTGTSREFALDVVIRAEIDRKDPEGKTRPYGFSIPSLEL